VTRRDRLGRHPVVLDRATIQDMLLIANVQMLATHYPAEDGLCPHCRERLCTIRLGAVRAVRSMGVKVAVLPPHPPRRPQWDCELCDCPWPCSQARVMLGDEYGADRINLAVRMEQMRREARAELPEHVSDAELLTRFVAWCWRD
jgi:hypothetical protein